MSDIVLDSCVPVKWVVPEADSATAEQLLLDTVGAGGRTFVLDLALIEIAQALWKQFHRRLLTAADVPLLLDSVRRSGVQSQAAGPLLDRAVELATRYDRSVYDCLFVALTVDLSLPGVTADEPLYNAVHGDHPQIHLLRHWPLPAP